jgi:prepilin-type N-terminal cleavage/methylation domain-containing protein
MRAADLTTTRNIPDRLDGSCSRSAFTLIELLVVIVIVLILAAVTITSFNFSVSADRMRAGARQLQSFLIGARDKAIYAREIRGVRLLLDPNDNHSVSAVQYIGSPLRESGTLTFDATGRVVSSVTGTPWNIYINRGLLRTGNRIQIPGQTGSWYTVSGFYGSNLILDRANRDFAGSAANTSFVLELSPSILGDSQPVQFPRGVVVDLDGSKIPDAWRPASFATGAYSRTMDILFSPNGVVVGDAAALGTLHLHFADASDVFKWKAIGGRVASPNLNPTNFASLPFVPVDDPSLSKPVVTHDRVLMTLSTRTGNVSVHHVNPTNNITTPTTPIENQKLADDPYLFAETGQVANK